MLFWVIQITVISIILIFLVHHLIHFFKSTLTVPKIKDLVNTPTQKYENMINIIKNSSTNSINIDINQNENINTNSKDYTLIDLLPRLEEPSMKNELKNFLKKQMNNSSIDSTNIETLDNMMTLSYSSI
jgi:hypothetical protein